MSVTPPLYPLPAYTGSLPAAFVLTPEGLQNWTIVRLTGGDLDTAMNLLTWVLISLFSWARDDSPEGERKGWWGAAVSAAGLTGPWGSRLWKLERAKLSDATLRDARDYVIEALDWLVRDKIADEVNASVTRDGRLMRLDLQIRRGVETLLDARFADVWSTVIRTGA